MARLMLKTVNAALAAKGIPERLVQGNGYLYFVEGNAAAWFSSSCAVARLNHLTLKQWLAEHKRLATEYRNWNGITDAEYDTKYGEAI